jgi:hypothetical protein
MAEITAPAPNATNSARSALRETGDSLRSVFRNPNLRRIQLSFAGAMIGRRLTARAPEARQGPRR